ncbi:MAG: ChaN family lipoprotein [Deltaproteobacteria bacterium]|nr:ChaN family lipoprotein [Deltaproteobacteria bacterium]
MAAPRNFRDELVALQREIYRRNQRRIHDAVEGDSAEFRRYERRYQRSLRPPRRLASFDQLCAEFGRADAIFLGDYHTLEQAQRSMLRILRAVLPAARPLTLAVEFVAGRHQAALDAFLADRIGEATFLRRIEYRRHWPFSRFDALREVCAMARQHGLPMLAIDLDARHGATLAARDRYAAQRLAGVIDRDPRAQVFCLIGELHLAPAHLPAALARACRRSPAPLIIHQNPERVYRALEAAGQQHEAEVVELARGRYALNVVPPIVCQHSFLRWLDADDTFQEVPGLRTAFREHVRIISRLLELPLDVEAALDSVQIETVGDLAFIDRLRRSGVFSRHELRALREQMLNSESYYVPRLRLVYLGTPSVNHSSEEAAHFLRHLLAGESHPTHPIDAFYDRAVNEALAFFASKLVNDKRKALHESAYRRLLREEHEAVTPARRAPATAFEVARARRVLEHKRLERGARRVDTELIFSGSSQLLDGVAHALGYMLGDRIYYALVEGLLDKSAVRAVMLDPLDRHGAAVAAYFALANQVAGVRVPRRV